MTRPSGRQSSPSDALPQASGRHHDLAERTIYWIGGSPCAGKSTVADRLATATADELWLRPVRQQVKEEIALYREEFPLILDDLRALPADRPVIAEGAALLPGLLQASGIDMDRAMWMVPTPGFQRRHYERRDWRHEVLRECSDPARSWENWMARDSGFAAEVARQARARNVRLLTVDGSLTMDATCEIARHWLGLPAR